MHQVERMKTMFLYILKKIFILCSIYEKRNTWNLWNNGSIIMRCFPLKWTSPIGTAIYNFLLKSKYISILCILYSRASIHRDIWWGQFRSSIERMYSKYSKLCTSFTLYLPSPRKHQVYWFISYMNLMLMKSKL